MLDFLFNFLNVCGVIIWSLLVVTSSRDLYCMLKGHTKGSFLGYAMAIGIIALGLLVIRHAIGF